MTVKVLLLGCTGLLGQAVGREAIARGYTLLAAARRNAPILCDIGDDGALAKVLDTHRPDLVVNCAALADIEACEKDRDLAWRINARPLALLSEWSRNSGGRLIHISTDHYFIESGAGLHDENAIVHFVNEYARTKFAGEAFALTAPRALVLRTNIVGMRGWERLTFAEWAIDVALNDRPATLFSDVYVSSIDVGALARAIFDLEARKASGLLNVAAGEVFSKDAFVRELSKQFDRPLTVARTELSGARSVGRANSLGLDVRRAEAVLNYKLPSLRQVVAAIVKQYRETTAA